MFWPRHPASSFHLFISPPTQPFPCESRSLLLGLNPLRTKEHLHSAEAHRKINFLGSPERQPSTEERDLAQGNSSRGPVRHAEHQLGTGTCPEGTQGALRAPSLATSKGWASTRCDVVLGSLGRSGAHHLHVVFEDASLRTMRLLCQSPTGPCSCLLTQTSAPSLGSFLLPSSMPPDCHTELGDSSWRRDQSQTWNQTGWLQVPALRRDLGESTDSRSLKTLGHLHRESPRVFSGLRTG